MMTSLEVRLPAARTNCTLILLVTNVHFTLTFSSSVSLAFYGFKFVNSKVTFTSGVRQVHIEIEHILLPTLFIARLI
jgi:hypothetical protein